MDLAFALLTLTSGFLFLSIMVTGAFFSRPVGTKLGGAGAVAAALAIYSGVQFGLPWWMEIVPALLLLLNGLLGIAALGGER